MTGFSFIIIVSAVCICLATTFAAFRRVWYGGIDQTEEFLRTDVALKPLWNGNVATPENGSLITVREGIDLVSCKGTHGLISTSTISRDLY